MIEEQTNLFSDSSVDLSVRAFAAAMCCGGATNLQKIDFDTFKRPSDEGIVMQWRVVNGYTKPFPISLKKLKNSETTSRSHGAMQGMGISDVYDKIVAGAPDKEIYALMRKHLEENMPEFNNLNMPRFMNEFLEPNMDAFAEACKQANLPKAAEFVKALKNGFMVFQPAQSVNRDKELVGA